MLQVLMVLIEAFTFANICFLQFFFVFICCEIGIDPMRQHLIDRGCIANI